MRLLLVLAIVLLPLPATADPASAKAKLCQRYPAWSMCPPVPGSPIRSPPLMEEEEPIEYMPPLVSVPNKPMPPVVDAPVPPLAGPPVAEPVTAPVHAPVVVAKPRVAPAPDRARSRPLRPGEQIPGERSSPIRVQEATTMTCAKARQGVGMPCWLIVSYSGEYTSLSAADKRKAQSCLSASERAAIASCFRTPAGQQPARQRRQRR